MVATPDIRFLGRSLEYGRHRGGKNMYFCKKGARFPSDLAGADGVWLFISLITG